MFYAKFLCINIQSFTFSHLADTLIQNDLHLRAKPSSHREQHKKCSKYKAQIAQSSINQANEDLKIYSFYLFLNILHI